MIKDLSNLVNFVLHKPKYIKMFYYEVILPLLFIKMPFNFFKSSHLTIICVSFAIEILLLICGSPGTGYTKEHTVRDL